MTGKPEEKTMVGNRCKVVDDTNVNGQPTRRSKLKGNVPVFRIPEDKTSCSVLNIVKTDNQGMWAARKERVSSSSSS